MRIIVYLKKTRGYRYLKKKNIKKFNSVSPKFNVLQVKYMEYGKKRKKKKIRCILIRFRKKKKH